MVNSVHHNVLSSISGSLSNVFGYVLSLVVRPLDFGYLAVEAGIQQGVLTTYENIAKVLN